MNGEADVFGFRAHLDRQRRLGDEVAGVRPDDAAADQALGLLVPQGLGQALVAAERERAAARRPREDRLAVFDPLGLGFRLRQARPGDFRIGVSDRGDRLGVKRGFVSARDLRRDLGLVRGLMRQHRLADDVADGEDVRHVGAHLAVDGDEAALVDRDARRVGADARAVRASSDRDQHRVERLGLRAVRAFERDLEPVRLRARRPSLSSSSRILS